jgi:hypothetical protein
MRCSTRFTPELLSLVERLAREDVGAADIHRAVGKRAAELRVLRPSYERTRQLVHELRLEPIVPGWGEVVTDVAFRARPATALLEKATDAWPIDEDAGLRRKARRPDT